VSLGGLSGSREGAASTQEARGAESGPLVDQGACGLDIEPAINETMAYEKCRGSEAVPAEVRALPHAGRVRQRADERATVDATAGVPGGIGADGEDRRIRVRPGRGGSLDRPRLDLVGILCEGEARRRVTGEPTRDPHAQGCSHIGSGVASGSAYEQHSTVLVRGE
jgi:hypothetical protein